jgi:hypothetical protein
MMRSLPAALLLAALLASPSIRADTIGNQSIVGSLQPYSVDDNRPAIAVKFVAQNGQTASLAELYVPSIGAGSGTSGRGYRMGIKAFDTSTGAPAAGWLGDAPSTFYLTSADVPWLSRTVNAPLVAGASYFLVLESADDNDNQVAVVAVSIPETNLAPYSQVPTERGFWQKSGNRWEEIPGVEPIFLLRYQQYDPVCPTTYIVEGNPYFSTSTAVASSSAKIEQSFRVDESLELSRIELLLASVSGFADVRLLDKDSVVVASGRLAPAGVSAATGSWYELDATATLSAAKSPYRLELAAVGLHADWVTSGTTATTNPCARLVRATYLGGEHYVTVRATPDSARYHEDAIFRLTVCRTLGLFYVDADGDGWGDDATATNGCVAPEGRVSRGGDCNDRDPSVHPGASEACNGADDDCDGTVDDLAGAREPCELTQGVCAGKSKTCGGTQGWLPCDALDYGLDYEVSETRCDGLDNDCDGTIDDIPAELRPACPLTTGVCAGSTKACGGTMGFLSCDAGSYGPDYKQAADPCDGKDNDCDGQTDEDPVTAFCSLTEGVCRGAHMRCVGGLVSDCSESDYLTHSPSYERIESSCDGLDNDCDGRIDNVSVGVLEPCYEQRGVCLGSVAPCGSTSCGPLEYAAFSPDYEQVERTCDGLDNDCDGEVDEPDGLVGELCDNQSGVCAGSRKACRHGAPAACASADLSASIEAYEEQETRCDGRDNDCDGAVDDIAAVLLPYCENEKGVCAGIRKTCQNGAFLPCDATYLSAHSPDYEPVETRCDGLDNDCDGITDPGELCDPAKPGKLGAYDLGGCGCGATGGPFLAIALLPLGLGLRRGRREVPSER